MSDTIKKIQSFLSLRKPSNKDDEKFISGIDSPYQAAKLRSASKDKTVDNCLLYTSPSPRDLG